MQIHSGRRAEGAAAIAGPHTHTLGRAIMYDRNTTTTAAAVIGECVVRLCANANTFKIIRKTDWS